MKRPEVGTLAWAEATGGALIWAERIAMLWQATVLQLRVLPTQTRWKLGLHDAGASVLDATDMKPPDSSTAQAAEALCAGASSAALLNHCVRTWLWARVFGSLESMKFDAELLYVACLLHDLGLAEQYSKSRPGTCCFAVHGSKAARDFVSSQGWEDRRGDKLAEAISLHLNVRVDPRHGHEAHLLNAGAAADITGLRFWELPNDDVRRALELHPRLGLKNEVSRLWKDQATACPASRARFLDRWLQFRGRIKSSPFNE